MAVAIGSLIIGGLEAAGVGGIAGFSLASTTIAGIGLSTVLGTAAIIGASIGLQYALAPPVPKPSDGSQALRQAVPPRIRGYGRNRMAGYYMLYEEANGHSYDIIAFHSGRISDVVGYYLHDDRVTLNGDGVVQDTFGDGRYGKNAVGIKTRLGTVDQEVSSFAFEPGISEIWTPDHIGKGIAWASLDCGALSAEDFSKVFPRGKPELSVVADLSPVWDPRIPGCLEDDESTWVLSYNSVLHLIDYLTCKDGGLGLDRSIILPDERLAEWMIEADLCDEQVAKADGTSEPRYNCHGWYKFDNKPEDVINPILATCDGWMAETGDGTLSLKVGVYRAPTVTLTEKHVFGFSLNYGQPDEQVVNQLDITFTDPANNYVEVPTLSVRDENAISRSGANRPQPLSLTWVQSNPQARRLAYRAIQRLNPRLSGSFETTLYGLRAIGERWIRLQYPIVAGLEDCVIEIQGAEIDLLGGKVTFNFNRIEPGVMEGYDPATDEGAAPVVPAPPLQGGLPIPDHLTYELVGNATDGYRIVVQFDDPGRSDLSYMVRYRLVDDGTGNPGPWVTQAGSAANSNGVTVTITTPAVQSGSEYEVQAATVGSRGSISQWAIAPGFLKFNEPLNSGYLALLEDI
jgi:hypothetical protein